MLLSLVLGSCGSGSGGSSSGSGGGSGSNYQFLYDHNAFELNGFTVRWASTNIKVYTAGITGAETAVNRWAGPVSFTFVNSSPGDGITFSWTSSGGNTCGVATTYFYNSGQISNVQVRISTNQTGCRGGLDNTLTHEAGHALGFFGHTSDGGLMDPDGGNSNITTPVRNFMTLLYSQPYGWDIRSLLSSKIKSSAVIYQKNGTRIMSRVDY